MNRLVNIEALKQEISEGITLDDVAERLCEVQLDMSGRQHRGLCPLHSEDSASFYVEPNKGQMGVWHCFGCKRGGDMITLVREVRHLGFYEALYLLAAEARVDISAYERPLTEEERKRDQLQKWLDAWLGDRMGHLAEVGAPRIQDMDTALELGIGLADTYSGPVALASDLARKELFRGVIFPYKTASGRAVYWKCRALDSKITYGVSNEWPLLETAFFGLDVAREHLVDGEVIVVEGEYDTATAHAHGKRNVIGLGGSNFTAEHLKILEDIHVRSVVLALDGDQGGRDGARKAAEQFWDGSIQIRIATLPEGQDPDSMLSSGDDLFWDMAIASARHALEWLLWQEWTKRPRDTLSDKLDFVSWVRATYGSKLRATDEALILREVAGWLGVSEMDVRDFVRVNEGALQAVDSERVVLGRAIREQRYYMALRGRMAKDDLFLMKHQRLWEVLERMLLDGLEFDVPTVDARAQLAGLDEGYAQMMADTGQSNLDWHEQQILDLSLRRGARAQAIEFREKIADPSIEPLTAIGELTSQVTSSVLRREGGGMKAVQDQVDKAMETLHERLRNPTEVHGLDLGSQLPQLTRTLQGLQSRRLVLVAAPSSYGKSTMVIQWATVLSIYQAVPTDLVSLEMDEDEVLFKIASHITQINSRKITGGRLSEEELRRVEKAMMQIRQSALRVYAPDDLTPSDFVLYAREQRMQRRSEVFFVDYAQLTSPDSHNVRAPKHEWLGDFTKDAKKKVARAQDCCVVVVAQLNRGAIDKERPSGADMGDSYQMVRDADVLCIIAGDGDDESTLQTVDLWVDKNRQGAANVLIPTRYNKEVQTFYESTGAHGPDYGVY